MSRTVLCVVELDNYPEQVVARAAWLAKLHDCDLELVLSDPAMNYLGESFVVFAELQMLQDSVTAEQEGRLQELADSAGKGGVTVRTSISHERPEADMVIDKAEECDAILVVKGTHWHTPSERASFAYTDWRLIRRLERPLWFVKPVEWREKPVIIAAVDPTHAKDPEHKVDYAIVNTAQELAEKCDGKVLLLHTFQRLEEIGTRATWAFKPVRLPVDEIDRKITEEHGKALARFAGECSIDEEAVHQLPGRAYEILPMFARSNGSDLVVMGGVARSRLKRRVGSTAAQVLDHLPCDVLIVHAYP